MLLHPVRFLTLLAAVIAFPRSTAIIETGSVSGRVREANGKKPIPEASVIIEGTSLGARSDDQGYFLIKNVPIGTQTVIARFIGYTPARKSVEVKANALTTLEL